MSAANGIRLGTSLIKDIRCPREAIKVLKQHHIRVVTDTTVCIPGKFYLVLAMVNSVGEVVPVMGPTHTDVELGVRHEHVHPDHRFMNHPRSNEIIFNSSIDMRVNRMTIVRRKCRWQNNVGLDIGYDSRMIWRIAPSFAVWYRKHIGKPCKGKKCPHFGIAMRPTGNGQLECPMHHLHCDENTLLVEFPKGKEEFYKLPEDMPDMINIKSNPPLPIIGTE